MTATCPQGHTSSTDDFCDVCGTPIAAAPADPAIGAASADPGATVDPGPTMEPGPTVRSEPTPGASPTPGAGPTAGASRPPGASPAPPRTLGPPKACPNCQATNVADALFCEDCGYDFATGQLPPPPAQIDPVSGRAVAPPPRPVETDWVAEVWVDPDWFAHQKAAGSSPTSGVPTVVALKGTVQLIGRRSRSRNINPEIDCSGDGAISHRHAELSLTGGRWSVKDLGSTNGTYVGAPGAYPDDALPPQQRRELADDERIYLGAWTRIVVRRATDAEKAAS